MDAPAVIVDNLTRKFGDFVAVDHVSFEIQPGEIVGYLGPNGSGKTTTIRMLLGLLKPSEGSARVLGYDCFRQSEVVRGLAGYMSQKFAIYDDLTVWENLQFYGGIYGITRRERIQAALDHVDLSAHARTLTRELSAGWRQRLALGIALVHSPRLLFLDEPTSGVDPTARRAFWDLIYDLSAGGVTILVTTHYMDEAEYCSRVGMMKDGKLLAMDTSAGLKAAHIPGDVWDIHVQPLLVGLDALATAPCVLRAGLAGDHLRVIARRGAAETDLRTPLEAAGVHPTRVQPGEATLEDVFTSLVKGY